MKKKNVSSKQNKLMKNICKNKTKTLFIPFKKNMPVTTSYVSQVSCSKIRATFHLNFKSTCS